MDLSEQQARVLGCLIEKQLTTPQQYPLTFNALVAACNQTSNREPVVSYDKTTIERALDDLKGAGLARFVHPSHGRSVIRYRQVLEEKLTLDERQLAVIAVLLLRGAQTAGELRSRTERMAQFAGISELEAELENMGEGTDPLVLRLARRPGQKEERWIELLSGSSAHGDELTDFDQGAHPRSPAQLERPVTASGSPFSLSELADQVASLRDDVSELREAIEALRKDLGS